MGVYIYIFALTCSIIGGVLIVIGLYVVLWGKRQEAVKVAELQPADETVDVVVVPGKAG